MNQSCLWLSLGLFALLETGCKQNSAVPPPLPTPTVTVSKPIEEKITDYIDFTGRTDAVINTDIKPQVSGYLVGMPFKEGDLVKKGDLLFKIDDSLYVAALEQAKGEVEFSKASVVKTKAEYDIGLAVQQKSKDAISEQEIVKRLGSWEEAKGNLYAAEGKLKAAQQNFDWCRVTSPIDGQINRYNLTLGNYAIAGQSSLTTVVTTHPMYVYFDPDENNYLKVMRHIVLPSDKDFSKLKLPVYMGLADEVDFPHRGYLNFVANALNPSTGTIQLRGEFENPANSAGKRLLRPGLFVRVRLPLGQPHEALLVTEKALVTDQANRALYVVNDQNVVDYRTVTLGPLQDNGLRVILSGVKAGERVIINGVQLVRAGMTVKVEEKPMPVLPARNWLQLEKTPEAPAKDPKEQTEPKAVKDADTKQK